MVHVTDLTDRRPATLMDQPYLARRKLDRSISPFFRHQLGSSPSAADELAALTNLKFNVVNHRSERDMAQRKRVPGFNIRFFTRHYCVPYVQPDRRENVTFLSVNIMKQRDTSGAIWIIFNCRNFCHNSVFLPSKVDKTESLLVPPSTLKTGYSTPVVTTTALAQGGQQCTLRRFSADLSKIRHTLETPSG